MKKTKKTKKTNEEPITTTISNNTFTGVHWDANAVESVSMVAKGLLNLSELFRSQNIQIDSMLRINNSDLLKEFTKKDDKPYVKKIANKFKKNKSKK
jgi:hypothetical protein